MNTTPMNEDRSHSARLSLDTELEAGALSLIHEGNALEAIKKLVNATGCPFNDAKRWVAEHTKGEPTPCPFCGMPLATDMAKQCFSCGMDWHDPAHVVRRGDPDWNRFGLKKGQIYVVQLCQEPNGHRYTKYRVIASGEPDPHRVFETESAPGFKFIEWGFYEYARHLRLSNGEAFCFDAHGIWMTQKEVEYLHRRDRGKLAAGEKEPWVNGIPPRFPPM